MSATSSPDAPSTERPGERIWVALLWILAAGSVANAAWMFVSPEHWYHELPAGVPDTGPLNVHFVRDIGCAFATAGLALGLAAWRPAWRAPLVASAACFYGLHALLHIHDTWRGLVDAHHWWLDAPGVYLPAILLVWGARRWLRQEATAA